MKGRIWSHKREATAERVPKLERQVEKSPLSLFHPIQPSTSVFLCRSSARRQPIWGPEKHRLQGSVSPSYKELSRRTRTGANMPKFLATASIGILIVSKIESIFQMFSVVSTIWCYVSMFHSHLFSIFGNVIEPSGGDDWKLGRYFKDRNYLM